MTIGVCSIAGSSQSLGYGPQIGEAKVGTDDQGFRFSFRTPRGYNRGTGEYGSTLFTLWPHSSSFAEIAKAMMQADPNAAIKAFGLALSAGVPPAEETSKAA